MLKEITYDIAAWWNEQSFPAKDQFKLEDLNALTFIQNSFIKERIVAYLVLESADTTLQNLKDKFIGVEAKFRDVELDWESETDKLKLVDKVENLKELLQHINAVGDFNIFVQKIINWQKTIDELYDENFNAKLKLVEEAERLSESTNWKETTQAYKELNDKWKSIGHIEKGRSDKLWHRLENARRKFHDHKRKHHHDEEEDMLLNLDFKIEIVEQAEALALSEEWRNTTEVFHQLLDRWKSIGKAPNKRNEVLWQKFVAAKNTFFDRKKVHATQIQQEHEANYVVKLALVEKAESLKESTDWTDTTNEFLKLMEEWKKSGRASQERGEELWKRFSEAQDHFFENKKQHFEGVRTELEKNLERKKELAARAEEIKDSTRWGEATVEFNQMFDEWKAIGPVPRQFSQSLWETFINARKHFFARKDENREQAKARDEAFKEKMKAEEEAKNEQRRQKEEARKAEKIENTRKELLRKADEIKEEEEKLADFKQALENITPGKKAEELRKHLENLIMETTEHLSRLKRGQ